MSLRKRGHGAAVLKIHTKDSSALTKTSAKAAVSTGEAEKSTHPAHRRLPTLRGFIKELSGVSRRRAYEAVGDPSRKIPLARNAASEGKTFGSNVS